MAGSRRHRILRVCGWLSATWCIGTAAEPLVIGVDANYSLGLEAEGRSWRWEDGSGDLFSGMAKRGVRGFRVRLWTGDDGLHGKHGATRVVKRAVAAGLDPYLVIFLSEDWADMVKQPAPAMWKDLSVSERAAAVKVYSREIVAHFRREGLSSHLYEIGNEIDYGICGVYPGKGTKKTPESLSRDLWPKAAEIIRASQEGVLESDPDAKFMLHIAHWWDADFCIAFFRFMLGNGVRVDHPGLSYFPSSNIGGSLEISQFGEVATLLHAATGKPVIIPETAYPATPEFKGQFSRWKKEAPGYPLSPEGQRRWISDFLGYCGAHPAISGVYYWSPEWYGEGMWKGFALFGVDGVARPSWSAFAGLPGMRKAPRDSLYLEACNGRVTVVPVDAARKLAAKALAAILARHERMDVGYIRDISATKETLDGYQLNLRASLSGNLDLIRLPEQAVSGAAGGEEKAWRTAISLADPAKTRVVLFMRDDKEPAGFTDAVAARGLECIRHALLVEAPLKFGLGDDWRRDAGQPVGSRP